MNHSASSVRASPRFAFVVGTRPEAIKLEKLIALAGTSGFVVLTGQHQDDFSQIPKLLSGAELHRIAPRRLKFDRETTAELPAELRIFNDAVQLVVELTSAFAALQPGHVVVQGDTRSAMAGSVAADAQGIPIWHVEAGLRSGSFVDPNPEEMFRRVIGQLAKYHFAATEHNKANLLREGVPNERIYVVGNTVVDGLGEVGDTISSRLHIGPKYAVVTLHRRQEARTRVEQLANVEKLASLRPDTDFLLFTHPNPSVGMVLQQFVNDTQCGNIRINNPLERSEFLKLLRGSAYVISDSGGVQEEAPYYGKRVFIVRDNTERPEAVGPRGNVLVGGDGAGLVSAVQALEDRNELTFRQPYPFGSGNTSKAIWQVMADFSADE